MFIKKLPKVRAVVLASACVLAVPALAQDINAVRGGNTLVTVSSNAPSVVRRTTQITGLGAGQSIVAIDGRPATNGRILFGISNTGQLYAINPGTGVASAVGAPIALSGTAFGFDFNPTVDRIRLVSDTGQNLRINPDTGAAIVDGNLNVLVGPVPVGVNGNTAAAYTNNMAGATSTTLFVINTQTGAFQIQNPPNNGTLTTIGSVGGAAATAGAAGPGGLAANQIAGFDISSTGEARLSVIQNGVTSLFSINLQTGLATLIGVYGPAGIYQGLAYSAIAFGEQAGLNANQAAAARSLDNFTSVAPGLVPLFTTLDLLPDDAARANAFTQLGPISFSILPDVLLQTNEFADGTMRRHMRAGRAERGGEGAALLDERRVGGFLIGSARRGDFGRRGDRDETEYSAAGIMAGVDFRPSETSMIGVAAGYDNARVQLNNFSGHSPADTYFVGAYGSVGFGLLNLDVAGSYGKSDFELSRNVAFGNFSSSSQSETDGRYYGLSATAGTNLNLGRFNAEPYIGVRYADVKIDGFSEGAALTNLRVEDQDVESLQGVAGARLGGEMVQRSSVVRHSVFGEYRREFKDDENRRLTSSFAGAGISAPFTTTARPLGRDHVVAGADLEITNGAAAALVLEYRGQFFGGYDIHGVQGGVKVRF